MFQGKSSEQIPEEEDCNLELGDDDDSHQIENIYRLDPKLSRLKLYQNRLEQSTQKKNATSSMWQQEEMESYSKNSTGEALNGQGDEAKPYGGNSNKGKASRECIPPTKISLPISLEDIGSDQHFNQS